jgi:radical SAM enzyme (TIGR01210 family)
MPDGWRFPVDGASRDRLVLERRSLRPSHDPWEHQGVIVEDERSAGGGRARVATVFLTGRECPWRCTMCDLWRYTTAEDTPPGSIPRQVAAARVEAEANGAIDGMKLYNAGSFFDPRAVPERDYDAVAAALAGIPQVIVESHPSLVTEHRGRVDRWVEVLSAHCDASGDPASLEVAIGLETAHPAALDRLNKRFTVDGFRRAAASLLGRGISLRVFLLISPPFVSGPEQDEWLRRSLDVSFAAGATVVSLVPTRSGNGAIEALAAHGLFRPPTLHDIERSLDVALGHAATMGRVFVDLWDLDKFATCPHCLDARRRRLRIMNLEQQGAQPVRCPHCGDM